MYIHATISLIAFILSSVPGQSVINTDLQNHLAQENSEEISRVAKANCALSENTLDDATVTDEGFLSQQTQRFRQRSVLNPRALEEDSRRCSLGQNAFSSQVLQGAGIDSTQIQAPDFLEIEGAHLRSAEFCGGVQSAVPTRFSSFREFSGDRRQNRCAAAAITRSGFRRTAWAQLFLQAALVSELIAVCAFCFGIMMVRNGHNDKNTSVTPETILQNCSKDHVANQEEVVFRWDDLAASTQTLIVSGGFCVLGMLLCACSWALIQGPDWMRSVKKCCALPDQPPSYRSLLRRGVIQRPSPNQRAESTELSVVRHDQNRAETPPPNYATCVLPEV